LYGWVCGCGGGGRAGLLIEKRCLMLDSVSREATRLVAKIFTNSTFNSWPSSKHWTTAKKTFKTQTKKHIFSSIVDFINIWDTVITIGYLHIMNVLKHGLHQNYPQN
jgi:hypothetical protein